MITIQAEKIPLDTHPSPTTTHLMACILGEREEQDKLGARAWTTSQVIQWVCDRSTLLLQGHDSSNSTAAGTPILDHRERRSHVHVAWARTLLFTADGC